jgi:hypothetical protein
MPARGQLVSGIAAKGRGRRSPRSWARATSIPYRMNRTRFFIPVTITLLSRANAAALQSARWVPPSLRAAARLRMSRSVPLLSAGTAGSSRAGTGSGRNGARSQKRARPERGHGRNGFRSRKRARIGSKSNRTPFRLPAPGHVPTPAEHQDVIEPASQPSRPGMWPHQSDARSSLSSARRRSESLRPAASIPR